MIFSKDVLHELGIDRSELDAILSYHIGLMTFSSMDCEVGHLQLNVKEAG